MKLARSERDEAWSPGSTAASNIGTSFAQNPGASMIAAIHGVRSAPPTIAMISPAAPSLCAFGSIPPRPMPYIVGNMRDMNPLIRQRQMTFAENGSPQTEKRTSLLR